MSNTPSVPPMINRMMQFMLRSPLHRLVSKNFLLITFIGRKSGRQYTTPVSYTQEANLVTIFTHAKWWKNLRDGAPVILQLRGQPCAATADAVAEDKQAVAAALTAHLRKSPYDAKFYDVTFDEQGNPRPEEVAKAVQTVALIQARLS